MFSFHDSRQSSKKRLEESPFYSALCSFPICIASHIDLPYTLTKTNREEKKSNNMCIYEVMDGVGREIEM